MLAAAGYTPDGTLPKALGLDADLDLERAGDVEDIRLDTVTVPSTTRAVRPLGVRDANANMNPFGSSRDTVTSATAAGAA